MSQLCEHFEEGVNMPRILGIIGLCLVLLVPVSGCGESAKESPQNLETNVSGIVALADRHIREAVNMMEVMAMTSEVQSANWETMEFLLAKADEVLLPGPKFFALPDGSYHVAGLGKANANIADREYFPILMSGENAIGQLVISRSTGEKVMVTAVPVKKNGSVIGALGASLFLKDLSEAVTREINLPDSMIFYAVTPANEIALHSDTGQIMESNPAEPDKAAFKTSSLTGWRFTLGYKE
jgi:hypothetical protein